MTYVVNESCIKCKYLGLRGGVSGGLLLRRREHVVITRTNASIAASASRNARRSHQAGYRAGLGEMAAIERRIRQGLAEYHDQKGPPPDGKEFEGVPNKFEKYFSPNPGTGD